eukprot:3265054-Prymnesium_polylepis.2
MLATAALCTAAAASTVNPLREISDPASGFTALVYEPPRAAEAGSTMPLLLYLHGAGETGTRVHDLISEGATGTPPVELEHGTALNPLAHRFVTVAPQYALTREPNLRPRARGTMLRILAAEDSARSPLAGPRTAGALGRSARSSTSC